MTPDACPSVPICHSLILSFLSKLEERRGVRQRGGRRRGGWGVTIQVEKDGKTTPARKKASYIGRGASSERARSSERSSERCSEKLNPPPPHPLTPPLIPTPSPTLLNLHPSSTPATQPFKNPPALNPPPLNLPPPPIPSQAISVIYRKHGV